LAIPPLARLDMDEPFSANGRPMSLLCFPAGGRTTRLTGEQRESGGGDG